jgi:hypothetical protein
MVSQVQVVSIFMIVHGALTSFMGLLLGAVGPTLFALARLDPEGMEKMDEADRTAFTIMRSCRSSTWCSASWC